MATRSLRHRSSRYSSPATFAEKEAVSKPVESPVTRNGQQTSLDKWMEPPVRAAVPSFEDTRGLDRVGVLENMQPLGAPPSQRLLQKLKLNYARPSPRATPAQPEEVSTSVAEPEKMDTASPMGSETLSEMPPDLPLQSDPVVFSSPPRGRPPRRDLAEMPQAANMSPASVRLSFSQTSQTSPRPHSIQEHLRQDRLQNHISRAVREAQQKGSPDLVPGLQKLRDDAQGAPDLWNVLEAVIQQSPSATQFKTFKRYIKSGIKNYTRTSQFSASPYQSSPEHAQRSPKTTRSEINSANFPEEPNRRISLYFDLPRGRGSFRAEDAPLSPSTMSRTVEAGHPNAKTLQAATSSPQKRKRSRSVSSSSSLSSAKSIPDDFGPPLQRRHRRRGDGQSGSAGQRQATSRGAINNRLRSTGNPHSSGKHSSSEVPTTTTRATSKKLKKSREEPEFDAEELAQRKQHLLGDSFHDYNAIPRPESNEREPIHGHPAQSSSDERPSMPVIHPNRLPPSHINLSSPVSAHAPPDTILVNGTDRKRTHHEVEAEDLDIITPESSSPAYLLVPPPPPGMSNGPSRGTTPRTTRLQPAPKTRKSARVMVS